MAHAATVIQSAANGSTAVSAVIPNDPALVGSVGTFCALRGSSSSASHTIESTGGGTFEQLGRPSNAQDGLGLAVGGASTAFLWRKEITADDLGETVTITSGSAAGARWYLGMHFATDVGPDDDVALIVAGSGGGTSLTLPAASPANGSTGGNAVHFALAYLNNNATGVTFSATDAVIRDQKTHQGASGNNPAMAVLDRTFTGDDALSAVSVGLSPSVTGRAGVTVIYSGDVEAPPVLTASAPSAAVGGARVQVDASTSGGTPPYSYAFGLSESSAPVTLYGTGASRWYAAPTAGGEVEVEVVVTDDVGSTDADVVSTIATARTAVALGAGTLGSGWSSSSGATNPAVVVAAGTSPTDYIESPTGAGGTTTIPLAAVPGASRTNGMTVYVEAQLDTAATTATATVELMEGATVRGTETFTPTTTRERYPLNFSAAEMAAVVDLGLLSLRMKSATT